MKKATILAICLSSSISINAYDFEKNGFYYNITSLSDMLVEVTNNPELVTTYDGDVIIPQSVEYSGRIFTVSGISEQAFRNCFLNSLTIPESVTRVEHIYGIFKKLIIEDSDIPIGSRYISLLGENVTESVYLGRNIIKDGGGIVASFQNEVLYKEITFGEKVTFLGDACTYASHLTNVVLPKTIKSLDGTFDGCTSLQKISGEGIESIDNWSFRNCVQLQEINFPNLKVIGTGAFWNCTMKSISLPIGLVSMRAAFTGCVELESVTIPSTITNIDYRNPYDGTFTGCNKIKKIRICNPIPISLNEINFDIQTYLNSTLFVPIGAADAYRNANVWKNFLNIEEDASITDDIFTLILSDKYSYGGTIEVSVNEALPAYNTYKFAKKGESLNIKAIPENNYKLSKLLINEIDVTGDVVDNVYQTTVTGCMNISALFEFDNTAVDALQNSQAKVYASDGMIVINNAQAGETVRIYNEAGMIVSTIKATNNTETIKVDKGHVYIILLNGKTIKVTT